MVRGDRDQDHPHGQEMQKSKMAVWGGLTNSCEKKRGEKQRRTGKIQASECRVPETSKDREGLLQETMPRNRGERLEISSRKLEISKEHFNPKMGTIKDRSGKDLTEAEEI